MRAIFWKELRENAKWAALGFLLFALGLSYGWSQATDPFRSYEAYYALLSPAVLLVTTLGAAVLGGALGLLQIMPEQARDRWAFLVHRPVPMTSIFWGKAAAGLLLYALATLPPFFVLAWWASVPGNLGAPFEWASASAGIADISCGALFYFAGLLTGLRKGRWWGSRALAVPAALTVLGMVGNCANFPEALIWVAIYAVVFLLAARSAFITNGAYGPQSWIGRSALFVVLAAGALQLVGWVQMLAGFALRERSFYSGTEYRVLKDGRPVAASYKNGSMETVNTLDGAVVPFTPEQMSNSYREFLPELSLSFRGRGYFQSYRSISRYLIQVSTVQNTQWFFVRRTALFELYERQSARHVGTLGVNGFFPADEAFQAEKFPGKPSTWNSDYTQSMTPVFDRDVYAMNPFDRSVRAVYHGTEGTPLTAGYLATSNEERSANMKQVAVGLSNGSIAIGDVATGQSRLVLANRLDPERWNSASVFALPDGTAYYVFRQPNNWPPPPDNEKVPPQFEQYNAAGDLVKQQALPFPRAYHQQVTIWTVVWGALTSPVVDVYQRIRARLTRGPNVPAMKMSRAEIISLESMLVASALAAALGLFRVRGQQMSARGKIVWSAAIFATGIPGLLAFIAAREVSARLDCAQCGGPRLVDRESCAKCGSGWPSPARNGSEIFASS